MNWHAMEDLSPSADACVWNSVKYFRQIRRGATAELPSRFVLLMEEPLNMAFLLRVQLLGYHQQFSRHTVGYLDGHAEMVTVDSRRWCGPGWIAINPEWVEREGHRPTPRYSRRSGKKCD